MRTKIISILLPVILCLGCQKVINVKLDEGVAQLSVSAFINSKSGSQYIVLSQTAAYFNNAPCPAALGATVSITDNKGNTFNFTDYNNNGWYTWTPVAGDTLVHPGNSYTLSIAYGGENYQSFAIANPVPAIDSMNYEFRKGDNPILPKAYYTSFYAQDIKDRPDYYWIKAFKNDSLLSPQQLDLSIDGAIGGPGGDGLPFIVPVRESINPFKGYVLGDTCAVELHSISAETYYFFLQVQIQTTNGGLFAEPPANVATNIKNTNAKAVAKAVGFFNVAMVSTSGKKIK
ncbi:MAG: DUF4249 domain-containing protein [Bacteroidia bacterium]|nr:DUF4249 domain-containing protein [Bacteroidia bacterium]